MQEITYHRPLTLAAALDVLRAPEARPLAGGTDLIPQLREGRRHSTVIVDIKHVAELQGIVANPDGGWRVGAAVSINAMRKNQEFVSAHRGLVESAGLIGSLQIQNRAGLAGNLCNAAPSADGVPLLFALDADAEVHGPAGVRRVPAELIPAGPGRASLAPGELLVALHLPPRVARSADRYIRFTPRREMDIAIAGAGVRLDISGGGTISAARIILASVGPIPIRARKAEATLVGLHPSIEAFRAAGASAAAEADPITDTRGSADYRRDLIAVLTRRALEDCAKRLGVTL